MLSVIWDGGSCETTIIIECTCGWHLTLSDVGSIHNMLHMGWDHIAEAKTMAELN